MPDGTTLVGVIYNAGKHDLLFYEDGIWGFVGSPRDIYVTAQPYGIDVTHGTNNSEIPALGPFRRPEARRLAQLLQEPRDVAMHRQLEAYNDATKRDERSRIRPGVWHKDQIKEIMLSKPSFARPLYIYIHRLSDHWYTAPLDNNDGEYVEKLIKACYPDRFRSINRQEEEVVRKQLLTK
jgi:hypothetical protein